VPVVNILGFSFSIFIMTDEHVLGRPRQ